MKRTRTSFVALVPFLLSPLAANADLIGDIVTLGHYFPNDTTQNFVAEDVLVVDGGAPEFAYSTIYTADVTTDGVLIDFLLGSSGASWVAASFNGFRILGIDSISITSLEIDTNMSGWDASRASFTGDSASFNWQGLDLSSDFYFNARFASPVPEPGTLALFGIGLLGIGAARRRKKA